MTDHFREHMRTAGRATLKVDGENLTDNSGQLRFPILVRNYGRHNMADHREHIEFQGPCGMRWSATRYGSNDMEVTATRCIGIRQLMEQLGPKGIAISLKDGEYRVNYKHAKEATAYYTTDPVDAFHTGLRMLEDRDKKATKPDA